MRREREEQRKAWEEAERRRQAQIELRAAERLEKARTRAAVRIQSVARQALARSRTSHNAARHSRRFFFP